MFADAAKKLGHLALSTLCLVPAAATGQSLPAWPSNPFAYTISDDIFAPTEELRFAKATRVLTDNLATIGDDVFDIVSYPLRDPATFGMYALGIGALVLVDKPTTTLYQQTLVPVGKKFDLPPLWDISSFPVSVSPDVQYVAALTAGTYAYGVIANDDRAQVAAMLSAKAVAYSYFTSHVVLKTLFGRDRPVQDLSGHTGPTGDLTTSPFDFFHSTGVHFDTFAKGTGMPSFHFTMYFATARVYSGVYDNYLIPYGLAAALALQSAEDHHHWVSDMAAGALIGTAIGNVVLSNYENRRRDSLGMVVPIVSSKGAGLGYQVRF